MKFNKRITNLLIIFISALALSACATAKKPTSGVSTSGDVYTGTDTVKYLASGVKDRVFFATNRSTLTSASRDTLRKQADYLRKNKKLNVVLEGHADERGTREYNIGLGEERAQSARQFLMLQGASSAQVTTISYGEERAVNNASNEAAYAQNRRVELVYTRAN